MADHPAVTAVPDLARPSLQESLAENGDLDRLLRSHERPATPTSWQMRTGEGPVVDLVAHLLHHAFGARASDVHLEPQSHVSRVRLRIDGTMTDAATLPVGLHGAVVNRIKVMADLDIIEHRRPQDGQFSTVIDGVDVDVRVSTLPTVLGEKLVLRLLDTRRAVLGLTDLGMSDAVAATWRQLMRSTFGLVLCTGPTGAGKTTTLVASLLEVDARGRNVTTIEDPVEYVIPGITQVAINERAGVTFATGLRALLRQDPDVILVGEIRDIDTARIAVQSALTGHLVLSCLHGTDAVGALYRLFDMGIERFLIASAISGVIAQRLVRRTCRACARVVDPPQHDIDFFRARGGETTKTTFIAGAGCDRCAGTGFRGRVGVFEVLLPDSSLRDLLVGDHPIARARQHAQDRGMASMLHAGIRLVEHDLTTIGEVTRLLASL